MSNDQWYNSSLIIQEIEVNSDLGLGLGFIGIIFLTLLIITSLGFIYYAGKKLGNDIIKVLSGGALVGGGYSGIKELVQGVTGIIKGNNTAPSGSESGNQSTSSGTDSGSGNQSTSSGTDSKSGGQSTSSGTGAYKSIGLPLFSSEYLTDVSSMLVSLRGIEKVMFSLLILNVIILWCFINIGAYIMSNYVVDLLKLVEKYPRLKSYVNYYKGVNSTFIIVELIFILVIILSIIGACLYFFFYLKFNKLR